MCEYCDKGKHLDTIINDSKYIQELVLMHHIENENIKILANLGFTTAKNKMAYITTGAKININYCPMCR